MHDRSRFSDLMFGLSMQPETAVLLVSVSLLFGTFVFLFMYITA